MKLRPALAAAVLLPLIGFAASWAVTHRQAQQGTDWDVPIAGYDPRDLLRGHYIQYSYEWPGLASENDDGGTPWYPELCITGSAPSITKVSRVNEAERAKCTSIVRAPADGVTDLTRGRFYVPQTRARDYERQLAHPHMQGIVRVRIREDGVMTPKELRFRALTISEINVREERAAREAGTLVDARQRRRDVEVTAPPPIIQ